MTQKHFVERLESAFQSRFVNLDELGAGGFGSVYSAYDNKRKTIVALKILHLADRPELKLRFDQEYAILKGFLHDRLVPVFDMGQVTVQEEHKSVYYWYTMRKFAQTIHAALPAMGLALRSRAVVELLEGLSFVHQTGIAHRDIKPENIFLDRAGHVVIGDFGIAKDLVHVESLTPTGMVIGDFRFLAPERWGGGRNVDWQKSDQYAAGMTAHYVLSQGLHPLDFPENATFPELAFAHVGPRRNLSVPDLETPSVEVNSVLRKMMHPEPKRRYSHIKEAMHHLTAVLFQEGLLDD